MSYRRGILSTILTVAIPASPMAAAQETSSKLNFLCTEPTSRASVNIRELCETTEGLLAELVAAEPLIAKTPGDHTAIVPKKKIRNTLGDLNNRLGVPADTEQLNVNEYLLATTKVLGRLKNWHGAVKDEEWKTESAGCDDRLRNLDRVLTRLKAVRGLYQPLPLSCTYLYNPYLQSLLKGKLVAEDAEGFPKELNAS